MWSIYNTGEKDFVLVSALSWLVTATDQRRIYSSIRHVIWWLQWEVVVVHCWGVELRCGLFGEAVGTINGSRQRKDRLVLPGHSTRYHLQGYQKTDTVDYIIKSECVRTCRIVKRGEVQLDK